MLLPSIFGENLFNDDWMDFSFPDVDKVLYGKHAKNVMKTDVKETDNSYEVDIDLPDALAHFFPRDAVHFFLSFHLQIFTQKQPQYG